MKNSPTPELAFRGLPKTVITVYGNKPKDGVNHFFTTKPIGEGNGFGLDTAYKMIDMHQGQIGVKTQLSYPPFSAPLPL